MMKEKIYVITHKKFSFNEITNSTLYTPLLVGAQLGNSGDFNYIKDNTGKNISSLNKSFCELTGLYWMWKNSNEDIIGLEHYRRYFVKNKKNSELLDNNTIKSVLLNNDIILPQPSYYSGQTSAQHFGDFHDPLVLMKCREIIKEKHPEFIVDFDWFSYQKIGYSYNMFIASKKLIDQYCEWLFDILFKLEKVTNLSYYNDYNQRMFGFVGERLFNVWLHHQNLKIKEYPVLFTGPKLSLSKRGELKMLRMVKEKVDNILKEN